MPSIPLVAARVLALAFAAASALRVAAPPKSAPFRNIVTDHRPPANGKTCRAGERWLDECRECLCAQKGVLRCRTLPCGAKGKRPAVVDGLVIPPHSAMRAEGAYTDHAFHSKRGAAADAAHQALAASLAGDSASDSDSDSASGSHERALGGWPETNYRHGDAKSPLAAFTWGVDVTALNAHRVPPVAQLPEPNVGEMCHIWLLNRKHRTRRDRGDYNYGHVTPLSAHAGGVEVLGYQIQRAPPVAQLPEQTLDEICRAWLQIPPTSARSDFAGRAISQSLSTAKDSTNKSMASPINNDNQPFPLPANFHLYQTSRLPHYNQMPQSVSPQTPRMVYLPSSPYTYNPYSHLPNLPSRLPMGYQVAPLSFKHSPRGPGFDDHQISLSLTATPSAPPPPPPEVRGGAPSQFSSGSLPEMIDMRSEDHLKMHPNAFSVPVRRRRSAAKNKRTPEDWKRLLLQQKFARPSLHLSEYLPVRISSGQPSQDFFLRQEKNKLLHPLS